MGIKGLEERRSSLSKTVVNAKISHDGRYFSVRIPRRLEELFVLDKNKKYVLKFEVQHPFKGSLPLLENKEYDYSKIECTFKILERHDDEEESKE